jgi:hypothetical protein
LLLVAVIAAVVVVVPVGLALLVIGFLAWSLMKSTAPGVLSRGSQT